MTSSVTWSKRFECFSSFLKYLLCHKLASFCCFPQQFLTLYCIWVIIVPFSKQNQTKSEPEVSIQKADVFAHRMLSCMPSWDFCKMCGRPLQKFFSWSTLHAWFFFSLNFPLHDFFLVFRHPPTSHNFCNGPSLSLSLSQRCVTEREKPELDYIWFRYTNPYPYWITNFSGDWKYSQQTELIRHHHIWRLSQLPYLITLID